MPALRPQPPIADSPPPESPRLWGHRHGPFAAASLALISVGAFENRAAVTALPSAMLSFDAVALFGLVVAIPGLAFVPAAAVGGAISDRRDPGGVLLAGLGVFGGGSILCAVAPTALVLGAGRAATGIGEALLDVSLAVMVALEIPSALRPRLVALQAAAWVLPSFVGPLVSGVLAEGPGWRWVFALAAACALAVGAFLVPTALRRRDGMAAASEGTPIGRALTALALLTATAGLTPALRAGMLPLPLAVVIATALGLLVIGVGARLVPRGTGAARAGLPTVIALAAGIAGITAFAAPVPTIAGFAVGLGSATLATARLDLAPTAQQGRAASAAALLTSAGTSAALLLVGLGVAAEPSRIPAGGVAVAAVLAVVSLLGALVARRVPGRR